MIATNPVPSVGRTIRKELQFSGTRISDQKRLVRGEHLLKARSALRARDEAHNRNWRVLILAGGEPSGEVNAIRELMPKANILAVDNDPRCLDAAINAGVDEVVQCDLTDWAQRTDSAQRTYYLPADPIARYGQFDLVCMDLCAGVNQTTRNIFHAYRKLLTPNGVMLLTFSYGRDVMEMFMQALHDFRRLSHDSAPSQMERRCRILDQIQALEIPDSLAGRLIYLFTPTELERVYSIMAYRGNEMPMCSVLYSGGRSHGMSFVRVEPGDFELAVVYPEAANLYDCPRDRIESLRRKFAAVKAAITRSERKPSTGLLDATTDD